jgi:hypothetical protein
MSACVAFAARRAAQGLFVFLICLSVVCRRQAAAQDVTVDRDAYYRAVDYCRHHLWSGKTLSPDRQILCFSAELVQDMDVSFANDLNENGIFAVRSPGGYGKPAMALANILRDRHATVVVYDYCISACANFLLIATDLTYVVRGALVLWHNSPADGLCTFLAAAGDGGPPKLQRGHCRPGELAVDTHWPALKEFLKGRANNPDMLLPADTNYVRRMVSNKYQGYLASGAYHDVLWTIHPRYLPILFKTRIIYEAYPESEEELNRILDRLHMKDARVIYDP